MVKPAAKSKPSPMPLHTDSVMAAKAPVAEAFGARWEMLNPNTEHAESGNVTVEVTNEGGGKWHWWVWEGSEQSPSDDGVESSSGAAKNAAEQAARNLGLKFGAKFSALPSTLPGGSYTAVKQADGNWSILNVPIFSENDRNPKHKVDKAWLEAALEKANYRVQHPDGAYLAPLHTQHHGTGQSVKPAGKVKPTDVREVEYDGEKLATMFGDLVDVPDESYQEIKAGKLPYRSVEIADLNVPEITSLALLDSDAPYFRYPMLTIGKELKAGAKARRMDAELAGMTAYSVPTKGSRAASFLYRADFKTVEDTMPNTSTKTTAAAPATFQGDEDELKKAADAAAKMAAEEPKKEDEPAPQKAQEGDPILALLTEIKGMLQTLCGGEEGEVAAPEGEVPAEGEPAEMKMRAKEVKPVKKTTETTPADAAKYAALEGKVAALESTVAAGKAHELRREKLASAMKTLKGFNFATDPEAKLAEVYKAGGEKGLDIFVSTIQEHGTKDPGEEDAEDTIPLADLPREVAMYNAMGPDRLKAAMEASSMYDAQNGRASMSRKEFIEAQMMFAPVVTR